MRKAGSPKAVVLDSMVMRKECLSLDLSDIFHHLGKYGVDMIIK